MDFSRNNGGGTEMESGCKNFLEAEKQVARRIKSSHERLVESDKE